MSHFTVAVFHKKDQSVEDLLAPYDENLRVDKYVEYTRQEAIEHARKYFKDTEKMTDEQCWQLMANDAGEGMTDEDGNIYSTYNPQSKWDWWQEGGRWSGLLKLHGVPVDSGRVGDVEFPFDQHAYEASLRFWDVIVDHKPQREDEHFFALYKEQYYRDYYGDRETYARHMAQFSTYAVVTPDGVWHGKGDMGWWGLSSESADEARDWEEHFKERFIDTADPDDYVTIVDCHI